MTKRNIISNDYVTKLEVTTLYRVGFQLGPVFLCLLVICMRTQELYS